MSNYITPFYVDMAIYLCCKLDAGQQNEAPVLDHSIYSYESVQLYYLFSRNWYTVLDFLSEDLKMLLYKV